MQEDLLGGDTDIWELQTRPWTLTIHIVHQCKRAAIQIDHISIIKLLYTLIEFDVFQLSVHIQHQILFLNALLWIIVVSR